MVAIIYLFVSESYKWVGLFECLDDLFHGRVLWDRVERGGCGLGGNVTGGHWLRDVIHRASKLELIHFVVGLQNNDPLLERLIGEFCLDGLGHYA